MGVVYRGWDPQLQREVALKLLRWDSPKLKQRLLREARAQARLNHPSICHVFEAGELEGEPFIAMQCIHGQALSQIKKHLNLQQKAEIGRQVAEALHAAHREGLIHRDIKPDNILVERQEDNTLRAYVTDFGLVRDLGEEGNTQSGVVLGTWSYMAPEQLQGAASAIDRRTDVYGLGATLYELLTGSPPYESRDIGELVRSIAQEELKRPRRRNAAIPADLEALVVKCLQTAPGKRYPSARALAEDLKRFLDGEPLQARPIGPYDLLWRRIKRRRRLLAVVLSFLLIILTGVLFWSRDLRRARQVGEYAERFITILGRMEQKLTYAYLSPPHDVTADLVKARRLLFGVEQQMKEAGETARGPGLYVLGRGDMLLGEEATAVRHLRQAWAAGYQRPEVGYALARSLQVEQERQRSLVVATGDPQTQSARLAEIEQVYSEEIRNLLQSARASDDEIPIEVLQSAGAQKYQAALDGLTAVLGELRWPIEGEVLRIRLETQRGDLARDRGDHREAQLWYTKAKDSLEKIGSLAASYPARHEAACALATSVLSLKSQRGEEVEKAYREAISIVDAFLQVTPSGSTAHRFYRQVRLLYAYWRFANSFYAKEELDEVEEDIRQILQLNPGDVEALRDSATVCRIRAFALYILTNSPQQHRMTVEKAEKRILGLMDRMKSLQPLQVADWHNLGAVRRLGVQTEEPEIPDKDYTTQFRRAEMTLRECLEKNDRYTPAYKDLGYIYYLAGTRAMWRGKAPDAWLEKSLAYSKRAVELVPAYYDAWDNLATVLGTSAEVKASRGEDPEADFTASEKSWREDIRANATRPYAYSRGNWITFFPWARHEFMVGGDWRAPLRRYQKLLEDALSSTRGNTFHRDVVTSLIMTHLFRSCLDMEEGGHPDASFAMVRSILLRYDKIIRGLKDTYNNDLDYKKWLRFMELRNALLHRPDLSWLKLAELRLLCLNFWKDTEATILAVPHTMIHLAEAAIRRGVSPETDLGALESYLEEAGIHYQNQARVKWFEGYTALIRAEWLKRNQRSGETGSSADVHTAPGADNDWKSQAQQADRLLKEALGLNRFLERSTRPLQVRLLTLHKQVNRRTIQ